MPLDDYFAPSPEGDDAFSVEAPKIKFGIGALDEIGADARALGMSRVALFTDPIVAGLEAMDIARAALAGAGLDVGV